MNYFSELLSRIEMTNSSLMKTELLVDYFRIAPEKDKLWVIALFTGKRPKRPVKSSLLKLWCREITNIPEWLFMECYATVGDLGETIALMLPKPTHKIEKPLSDWLKELYELHKKSEEEKKAYVLHSWSGLRRQECFIFNKLIGGSFRIGVSKKGIVNALAKYSNQSPNQLMHSITGKWEIDTITFAELVSGAHINYDNSKPYPFCLAYSLDKKLSELGDPGAWQVEYKWDGVRGQIVKRNNKIFIWSRGEEIITDQFPELIAAFDNVPFDFVLDGEIIPIKDGSVLKFNDLQKRLNRKNVTKRLLQEVPIGFYVYDCMEIDRQDIREEALSFRRKTLEKITQTLTLENIKLSEIISFEHWAQLPEIRRSARIKNSEGLMLKHLKSPYHVGRKKGDWWKWKVDPSQLMR